MELREAPWEMWQLHFVVALASIARLHRKSSNTETILKMCIVRRLCLLQSRHAMRLSRNLLEPQSVLKWTNASKTCAFREYLAKLSINNPVRVVSVTQLKCRNIEMKADQMSAQFFTQFRCFRLSFAITDQIIEYFCHLVSWYYGISTFQGVNETRWTGLMSFPWFFYTSSGENYISTCMLQCIYRYSITTSLSKFYCCF